MNNEQPEQENLQRQQLECALAESEKCRQHIEKTLNEVLNAVHAAICQFQIFSDRTWNLIYYSAGCELVYSYTAEELLADRTLWRSRILPEDFERVILPCFDSLFAECATTIEYRFQHRDGTLHWISETLSSRRDEVANCWIVTSVGTDINERKLAEAALRESEQRFHQIAEQIRQFFFLKSAVSGEYLYISPAYERIWGHSCESLYRDPQSWLKTIHPDDRQQVYNSLAQQAEGNQVRREYRIIRPDGSIRWIWAQIFPIYDAMGTLSRYAGLAEDITESKQAEQQIRFQANILNQVRNAAIATDLEGRIIYWNQFAETLYQWTAEEVMGRSILDITIPPSQRQQLAIVFGNLRRDLHAEGEFLLQRRDGSVFPALAATTAIQDERGDAIGFVGVSVDISDRKQVEEALQRSEAKLNDILNAVNASITCLIVYADGKVEYEYISRGCEIVFGFSAEELRSDLLLWRSRVLPEDWDNVIFPYYQALLAGQSPPVMHKYRFRHRDGSWRWISDTISPRRDEAADRWIVTTVAIDITESKQLEQSLRSQAEQERLLSTITAHIRQSLDLDRILATTAVEVQRTLHVDRALIFRLYHNGLGEVIQEAVVPESPAISHSHWFDECFLEKSYEYYCQAQPRIVPDVATDEWGLCLVEFMQSLGVKSKMVAPIIQNTESSSKVWGLLIVHVCSPRQWQQSEADFLQQIADQLAIAIYQSQLYAQTQQQAQREQAFNRMIQTIRNTLDLETIFSTAAYEIGNFLQVDRTDLVHYLPEQKIWRVVAAFSRSSETTSSLGLEIPDDCNPLASRLKQFEIVQIDDANSLDDRINRSLANAYPGSWLLVPIKIDGQQIWGSLTLLKYPASPWQAFEIELTRSVADQLAIAIQQAALYQKLQAELAERAQAEAALRHSETRFRTIFADAPVGMALTAPDGKIAQVNQALCQMLNYREFQLRGVSLQEVVYPTDFEQEQSLTRQLLAREISSYKLEQQLIRPNGEQIWVSLTAGLLQEPNSEMLYTLRMYENITERRTVERMKDNFISVVSHELRTPLTSIRGSLGLLATGQLGTLNAEGQELLNIAVAESQRLTRLVSDILDLERLKSGHIPLVRDLCPVPDLIARSIDSVRSLANAIPVQFEVNAVSDAIWVDGDRIIQTLTNLLSNAIKFSPPHTMISIQAEWIEAERDRVNFSPTTTYLRFCICDRGRGIPPDKLKTIFKPFEQVDIADSRQKGGSGLGLAICQSIIQRHGGQIWATSRVGEGSRFFFTLPRS